jgi:ABC-type Fe3+-hydroxamate transport system substrate-binding protein
MFRDTLDDCTMGMDRRSFIRGGSALAVGLGAGTALAQGATREITTEFGTYGVPVDPQRIVLMGNRMDLEVVTALGFKPVAMGVEFTFANSHADSVAPWVPFDPAGVETFPAFETTAEQILVHDPDLIVTRLNAAGWDQPRTDALRKIAPFIPTDVLPWREETARVAAWLGREAEQRAAVAAFDALRDEIRARHKDKLATAKVAFGSIEIPQIWVTDLTSTAPASQALAELGGTAFVLPPEAAKYEGGWAAISPENLGLLSEADALLYWGPTPSDFENFRQSSPLWDRLPAVQAGRGFVSENNIGNGSIYTVMEAMRLWDKVYASI